jgi:hypothetical protein
VSSSASAASLALVAGLLTACGGGAPLLHPAHTLPQGDLTFAAGTSGHLALGGLRRTKTNGSLVGAAVAPGVAPFVAGRVGLGQHSEGGLSYTGRGARLDARHAFEWPSLAVSVGGAALGTFADSGREAQPSPEGAGAEQRALSLDSVSGYGFELPVMFGYRSSADVVKLWTGLRAGFDRYGYNTSTIETPGQPARATGKATRIWGGGLVGFAIGLSPVEVRVEVDAAYESAWGKLVTSTGELTGDAAGWSLTPAMAISAKF